jgi:hypothetical protein
VVAGLGTGAGAGLDVVVVGDAGGGHGAGDRSVRVGRAAAELVGLERTEMVGRNWIPPKWRGQS